MKPTARVQLPAFTPERFADRLAEALALSQQPENFQRFPRWTQKVMLILRDQLVPPEFASMLTEERAIFCEGVCVAWLAHARDIVRHPESSEGRFARKVADRLTPAMPPQAAVRQIESGEIIKSPEFQQQVMNRLFSGEPAERRLFTEGLLAGNRAREFFDQQAARNTTDATGVYLLLWLYWPEIAALRSIGETARALEGVLGATKNVAGSHWEERFRKLANRIGLSFRAQQQRRRRVVTGR
jgi:hypothetical protein